MKINTSSDSLFNRGSASVVEFCKLNRIVKPKRFIISRIDWNFDACAYYRNNIIYICLEKCGHCCTKPASRNWTWPGSTIDREPFGVVCHELGHHCDWTTSEHKKSYSGNYSENLRKSSGEKKITNYCPNDAEWFAEMFRVFITNSDLLRLVRPKTYELLRKDWEPVESRNWLTVLGTNAPQRVIDSQRNKFK